jgi:seryl-tRNA synthetase
VCSASETEAVPATTRFLRELIASGLLIPTGVAGVFGRSGAFESVVAGIDALVEDAGSDLRADVFRFPPLISRELLERSEYLGAFPQLIGSVHSFTGDDTEHAALLHAVEQRADWTSAFSAIPLVLTPAACYPVYGMLSGTLPEHGRTIDVMSYCFRHEPSDDPARMQAFRMHEFVRLGSADACVTFRDEWLKRGVALLQSLELAPSVVPANDPFFGRRGRLLAKTQREQSLKYEIVIAITSSDKPTAVASSNWHQDHFGELFEIAQADGTRAHTACVGFGLERVTLALLMTHGTSIRAWPAAVRHTLQL